LPGSSRASFITDGVGGFDAHQDDNGNWVFPGTDGATDNHIGTTWYVDSQFSGASLRLTATGLDSGAAPSTDFTDQLSVTIVSPSIGTTLGGTSATITGAGFTTGQVPFTVSFDGGATFVSASRADNTHLITTTSAHESLTLDVVIRHQGGAQGEATLTNGLTYQKVVQTNTFNTLRNKTYGDADFNVAATASSGLAVSFSIVAGASYGRNPVACPWHPTRRSARAGSRG
jgi:hypothetical protein